MSLDALKNKDYTLIVDKSGSMSTKEKGKSRWETAREGTIAIANKLEELDPDGITVYTFANSFKRYDNVTASKVADIWAENEPNGGTDLALVLKDAFGNYFKRKAAGETKENGDMIVVITDGEPNDQGEVVKEIIAATKKMDKDEELSVSLIQIGNDSGATKFLEFLDDGLVAKGAKFDIVDTKTASAVENMTMAEVLLAAIND